MSYSKRAGDTEDPRLEELEQLHWDPIVDWFGQVTAMATIRDHRLSNKSIHLVDHVHNTHADIWRNESESWLRAGECLKLSKHHLGKRARDIYPIPIWVHVLAVMWMAICVLLRQIAQLPETLASVEKAMDNVRDWQRMHWGDHLETKSANKRTICWPLPQPGIRKTRRRAISHLERYEN